MLRVAFFLPILLVAHLLSCLKLFKVFSTSHQSFQKLICDTSEWSLEQVCAFLHAFTKVLMCVEFVSDIVDI